MKKLIFCLLLLACFVPSWAVYYVTGNGASGNPWCNGIFWGVKACAMTDQGDGTWSLTFADVPAGAYEFKVTDGTNWFGVSKFSSSCSNIEAYGSDNIMFTTQQTQDITVSYNGSSICLRGTGDNSASGPVGATNVGVPAEYEGVMLQAFYWNSHNLTTYSNTRYSTLSSSFADEMGETFDLVWLPPSGNGGGVGYYTKCYSNLSSAWGSKAELQQLIATLHRHDCKVVADIVINHMQSASGWAKSFNLNNFESYGSYQITSSHICSGDEAFTSSSSDSRSLAHGNADTGTNDGGCRDLDHTQSLVQDMCKAYTQWMKNTIGFDGFRYDMTKGYAGTYLSMYNQASDPFFSVSEYWDGDLNALKGHLAATNYNTLVFDFPLKYKLNNWKGSVAMGYLRNTGLRSVGLSRYAVTFIDNHDTFHRSDNQSDEFIGYNTDLSSKKSIVLQANAYLLLMPGVPCVFWPHWYTFRTEIKQLVAIRKQVGIHSESEVRDEAIATGAYTATIIGHRGSAVLRIGSNRDTSVPAGYTLAMKGDGYDVYTSSSTAVEQPTMETAPTKRMIDGTLYIIQGDKQYTIDGQLVK